MSDETAWLIERGDVPEYLGVIGRLPNGPPEFCMGKFFWTTSHHDALRFSRQKDAVLFVGAISTLLEDVPHKATLAGLRTGDKAPRVCEHMWSDKSLTAGQER